MHNDVLEGFKYCFIYWISKIKQMCVSSYCGTLHNIKMTTWVTSFGVEVREIKITCSHFECLGQHWLVSQWTIAKPVNNIGDVVTRTRGVSKDMGISSVPLMASGWLVIVRTVQSVNHSESPCSNYVYVSFTMKSFKTSWLVVVHVPLIPAFRRKRQADL